MLSRESVNTEKFAVRYLDNYDCPFVIRYHRAKKCVMIHLVYQIVLNCIKFTERQMSGQINNILILKELIMQKRNLIHFLPQIILSLSRLCQATNDHKVNFQGV